jgi:hypothetical protein
MSNFDIKIDEDVLNTYSNTVSNLKLKKHQDDVNSNILVNDIISKMSQFNYTQEEICDMLVQDMFKNHTVFKDDRRKEFLFKTYGDIILENIIHNKNKRCVDCGKLFDKKRKTQCRCAKCQQKYRRKCVADNMKRMRCKKNVIINK